MLLRLKSPKNISQTRIEDYLSIYQSIYGHRKEYNHILFDYGKVKSISLLGQLLVYKTLLWTAQKKFYSKASLSISKSMRRELKKTGMHYILGPMLNGSKSKWFGHQEKDLQRALTNNFFIDPVFVMRTDESDIQLSKLLARIEKFYHGESTIVELLGILISEVYGNFSSHATDDEFTIMAARGTREFVEFGFVDNGQGIVSSLKDSRIPTYGKPLSTSITRCVTSKKGTNHMGFGLWLVSEICRLSRGQLIICSEGSHLSLSRNNVFIEKRVGFWKGTIMFMRLNLRDLSVDCFPKQ